MDDKSVFRENHIKSIFHKIVNILRKSLFQENESLFYDAKSIFQENKSLVQEHQSLFRENVISLR